ncbi:helix-turn-helix domain-containing protein [Microbacter sp. GSS18]|nr:helix-turn-helix domain-containing protein [Microbacter sp. GSS18]
MPKYARPADGEDAENAIAILGNMVKAGIIRYLRTNPGVTRKTIADALQVPPTTVVPYLRELEEAGLLIANPPRTERRRGEWPTYSANNERVADLYLRLGQAIGEL